MLTQVATRCKLTSKCTWDHLNSLWFVNQVRKMSEREYAKLKRMLGCQNVQERLPLTSQYIFIRVPQRNRAVRHWTLLCAGAPDAPVWWPSHQLLDRCHVSSFKSRSFDRNGHLNRTTLEHSAPDTQVLSTWRLASVRSTDSSRVEPNIRRSTVLHQMLKP
jgi:hypothetical protein